MAYPLSGVVALAGFPVFLLLVCASGRRLVHLLLPDSTAGEQAVFGFAAGMAGASLLTTVLLAAQLPVLLPLTAATVAGGVWARSHVVPLAASPWNWVRERMAGGWGERAYLALVALFGALGVVGCLAPETGWDTGVYHFAMPKQWAEAGGSFVRPDVLHSYVTGAMESLFAIGFAVGSETFASLFNLSFYFGGLALVRMWAGAVGGRRAGLLAGLAFLTSTTYVLRSNGGAVEVGQAVYLGMALYFIGRQRHRPSTGNWILCGLGLGMVLGIKYTGGWAAAAAGAIWLALRWRDRARPRALLAEGAWIACLTALVACPMYVRNFVATGDPVYPFLSGERVYGVSRSGSWDVGFRAVFEWIRLEGLVLVVLPAVFAKRTAPVRWVIAASGLFLVLIVGQVGVSYQNLTNALRFWSPCLLGLWVVVGLALDAAVSSGRTWRWLGIGALLAAGGIALGIHAVRNARKVPVAIGWERPDVYLSGRVSSYWAMKRAETLLDPGEKVLLLEERSYYLDAPFVMGADIQYVIRFEKMETSGRFRAFLRKQEIGAVVYNHAPGARTRAFRKMIDRSPTFLRDAGVIALDTRNDCTLYRVD